MALLTNINGKFSVSDAGAVTFNNAFTFPTADGTANYVLKTNGSGQLAWAADSYENYDYWILQGDSASNININSTNTLKFVGGTYIDTSATWAGGSNARKLTINHETTSRTDTTSTDSPAFGGTFEAVTSVTTNTTGHITAIDVSTVTIPTDPGGTVKGTGTATRVAFWSASDTITSDADLYWDNTNNRLGIGTTTPSAKLTVTEDAAASKTILLTNNYATGVEKRYSSLISQYSTADSSFESGFRFLIERATAGNFGSAIGFMTELDSSSKSFDYRMYIKNDKVGIGTTSPVEKLEVSGSVKIGNMKFEPANGGRIGFNRNTSTGAIYDSNYAAFQINGAYASADFLEIQNYASTGGFLGSVALKNGNFGIGTDSPGSKVEIVTAVGADAIRMNYGQSADIFLGFNSANPRILLQDNSNVVTHNFQSNGDNYIVGSNVGIGQTSPSFKLDVNGTGYYSDLLRVDEPVYSYTNSGTKHYTHLATGSLYGSGASAAIITTNIPGHNISGNGNMFSFKIVGYAYTMGIIDMTVGLYAGENNFYSAYWSGTCQDNWIGNVYVFTNSAGATCIQLGEVTDVLNCEIAVTDFVQGFGNVNANYSKGWSIAAVTTLPTQNQKTTLNYKTILPDVYEDVTFHDNVGIGETNPAHKLSIKATDDTRGILVNNTLTTSYAEVALKASREFRIGTGGSASATDARDRWYVYDATASTHRLTLDSSGNFGIGETSPTRRLVLDGTFGTAALEIKQNSDRIIYFGTGSSADNVDQPLLLLYDAGVIKVNISSIADSYFNGGNAIIGGTAADQAGSFTAKSDGFIRGVLASGSNDSSLINAISGVSNGFQLMNNASNEQEYRFHSSHTGGPGISFKIEKTGTITAAGDVIAYSDKRLKSNIKTLDGSKVYDMRGVSFIKDSKKGSGVIAQEMQKIAPELVNEGSEYLGVAYGNLSGYLIEAIKELKAEIEELKLNKCNCNK